MPNTLPVGAPGAAAQNVVDETAEAVKSRFLQFLCEFDSPETGSYSEQAELMKNAETTSLFVDFRHVKQHDEDLANAILAQYYRYEKPLKNIATPFMADALE